MRYLYITLIFIQRVIQLLTIVSQLHYNRITCTIQELMYVTSFLLHLSFFDYITMYITSSSYILWILPNLSFHEDLIQHACSCSWIFWSLYLSNIPTSLFIITEDVLGRWVMALTQCHIGLSVHWWPCKLHCVLRVLWKIVICCSIGSDALCWFLSPIFIDLNKLI